MPEAEADRILETQDRCVFNRSPESDPILWTAAQGGQAAMKLNGVLVSLDGSGDGVFASGDATVSVRTLGDDADWRSNADLVFRLAPQGFTAGYRGFWTCPE
jgi:hypothetical protein